MAIKRQFNFLGNQRVDVPHLRMMESAVAADFQALSGTFMSGTTALVASGAVILDTGMVGQPSNTLVLRMANAVLLHGTATEPGAIFTVPSGQADDTLNSANAAVVGSFTPNVTNYISIDLVRTADATTQDTVVFRSSSTGEEFPQVTPLGRVLNYTINISTNNFGATPTRCPVAKVVTDASNSITSIVDCRQMFFRLGKGGTSPDPLALYPWGVRNEALSTTLFGGGDKDITSQYGFNHAIQHRMWELGGGEHWYSPASDREVKLTLNNAVLPATPGATTNFWWDGTDLTWAGLTYVFANSTAETNVVLPAINPDPGSVQPSGYANLTTMLDGDVIYVDLDRTVDGATIQPYRAHRSWLLANQPALPGIRRILAWRVGTKVFAADDNLDVTAASAVVIPVATAAAQGTVKLNHASPTPGDPKVAVVNASDWVVVNGVDRLIAGILAIGTATANALSFAQAGITSTFFGAVAGQQGAAFTQSIVNTDGITGTGNGTGDGVQGTGGATGVGVRGLIPATGTYGVYGDGTGAAADGTGVYGVGRGTGYGIFGDGASSPSADSTGVYGVGKGTGSGVRGSGGTASMGVYGIGGTTAGNEGVRGLGGVAGGHGVKGLGVLDGYGGHFTAGVTPGARGVYGTGGVGGGEGVYGVSVGAYAGVKGQGSATNSSHGVHGIAGSGLTSVGVYGIGGATTGVGVQGTGTGGASGVAGYGQGIGVGVAGYGGGTNAAGVYGAGGGANGIGVVGQGYGTGAGVDGTSPLVGGYFRGTGNGSGVQGVGAGTGNGGNFQANGTGYAASFVANATRAPIHLAPLAASPSTPAGGDIYYNDITGIFYGYNAVAVAWQALN